LEYPKGVEHEFIRGEGAGREGGKGEEEGLPQAPAPCVYGDDARVAADGDEPTAAPGIRNSRMTGSGNPLVGGATCGVPHEDATLLRWTVVPALSVGHWGGTERETQSSAYSWDC